MKIDFLKLIFFIFILVKYSICQIEKCTSNLSCNTTCCKNSQCVDQSLCVQDTRTAYIWCGAVGLVFIIGVLIYFVFTIKDCRNRVDEMRKNLLF